MTGTMEKDHLLTLTSDIVASHVANNRVETASLPELIREIYTTLSGIAVTAEASSAPRPEPAVPVKKSITADYLICLEDGKKLKMLKRHLQSSYKMTPEQYRARWDLPADYPMVAPNYATQRRELAKKIGLGTTRRRPRR